MECVPPASVEVVNAAFPAVSATVASVVMLSLKVTVPVGVPELAAFTVAVNVTDWPNVDGFSEDTTAVDVACLFTTCDNAGEVLPT
jgi:hypothetical protein